MEYVALAGILIVGAIFGYAIWRLGRSMDWTHLILFLTLVVAAVVLVSLLIWDRANRLKADAEYRALLERLDQTLERISDHTRHTGELAARAAEISARNERLTIAVLQQFQPQGQQ